MVDKEFRVGKHEHLMDLEDLFDSVFRPSDLPSTTATSSATPIAPLTVETILKAIEMLPKRVVIRFIPWEVNHIYHGEMIDEALGCRPWEKGFLVPRGYRDALRAEGYDFEER